VLLLREVTPGGSVEVGGFLKSARETAKLPQSREVELTVRQRPEAALPPSDTREAAPVPTELRADQPVLSTLPGKWKDDASGEQTAHKTKDDHATEYRPEAGSRGCQQLWLTRCQQIWLEVEGEKP
jgi:hypothetical protein